jgi:hypothetical protein
VWFLPRYGRYTKAAILHDHQWRDLATNGEISWVDADALFRRARLTRKPDPKKVNAPKLEWKAS